MTSGARLLLDLFRIGVLVGLAGWLLYDIDPANVAVFQAMLIGLFFTGGTHVIRRVLFPKLDLQAIAIKAILEKNLPAALIFFSIVIFLLAVLHIPTSFLR